MKPFTEKEVLSELDHVFDNMGENRSNGDFYDNFFLWLNHAELTVAGNRIHLYADSIHWAIVFESNGYCFSSGYPEIDLTYIGNCIKYEKTIGFQDRTEYSNLFVEELIDYSEVDSMEAKEYSDNLIRKDLKTFNINGHTIQFKNDPKEYEKYGIELDKYNNPEQLISFENLIRYLNETQPEILYTTEKQIKSHLLQNIPKLMTIDQYHYTNYYEKNISPSQQELFQLIAKILATKDTTLWKPTLPANNHWSNWESGVV